MIRQCFLDAGQKLRDAEWLCQVVVCVGIESVGFGLFLVTRGQDDGRDGAPRLQRADNSQSVQVRQTQVEQDDIGSAVGDCGERVVTSTSYLGVLVTRLKAHRQNH